MSDRTSLQTFLEELSESKNVYFDPPASVQMNYNPHAIRYTRKTIEKRIANDNVYTLLKPYELVVISKSPESPLIDKLLALPYCSHDRHYKAENFHHDVFTLYY